MSDDLPPPRDDIEELARVCARFCDAQEAGGRHRASVAVARTKFSEAVYWLRQDRERQAT